LKEAKMDLRTAKILGGIGAILTLFFIIPFAGWFLSIAGVILVLISVKTISDLTKEHKIFTNYLVAAILSFVGSLALLFGGAALMFRKAGFFADGLRNFSIGHGLWNYGMMCPDTRGGHPGLVILAVVITIVVAWVFSIVAGYFTKSSFDEMGKKTGEKNFKTAGLLIFLGSIFLVLFGAGVIVLLVGVIFEIIAFFSLPNKLVEPELPQT
jgi:uncharacterized membrane protein